jgi:DNA-binding beta-propeller fold protein YncE
MELKMKTTSNLKVALSLVFVLLLAGCAGKTERPRLFWPTPPSEPRLEYINTFYSQLDFQGMTGKQAMRSFLGEEPELFKIPFGVASDGAGKVFVSDPGSLNVLIYDFNTQSQSSLMKQSSGLPYGMDYSQRDRLYVAMPQEGEVHVFSPKGQPLFSFGKDQMAKPFNLAVDDRSGRVFVADTEKHQVFVYDLEGQFQYSIGRQGYGEGEFFVPAGVDVGPDGRVYVVETLNARFQIFEPDGTFIRAVGERGDRVWQFDAPKDIAVDSEGNVHVVDFRQGALKTFSSEGDFLLYTGAGQSTNQILGFGAPSSIAIDSHDRIYIADLVNRRFSVWQYLSKEYLKKHPITPKDLEQAPRQK